jgi:3-hydroxymyristoyl/3-hydroxydecanoyl-(acyl carrier protein) dehydratase
VFSLDRAAPDPTEELLTANEIAAIKRVTAAEPLRPPHLRGQPVSPGIRCSVVLLAPGGAGVRRSTGNCL